MRTLILLPVLVFGLALSACAPAVTTPISPTAQSITSSKPTDQPTSTVTSVQPAQMAHNQEATAPVAASADLARTDDQGAVQFNVTPLNLANPGETLDFEVSMNTHSVDLGMNLAELATLSTDTGQKVMAQKWVAPGGGHHVAGKLLFPATVAGKPLLKGATKVTLSLRNVDAPERTFTWTLQ